MTPTPADLRAAALAAHAAGLHICPPTGANDYGRDPKAPIGTWKRFQTERPSDLDIEIWYSNGRTALGVVTGNASGIEAIDFDDRQAYGAFIASCRDLGLGELVDRIEAGYCESTPNGEHWLYKCDVTKGNKKLANRANGTTKIETRGEGGFLIVAPSTGLHSDGRGYVLRSGGFSSIATITPDERRALHDVARMLDESHASVESDGGAPRTSTASDTLRPGDDFNARGSWDEALPGWVRAATCQGLQTWRRPGKSDGWSATTGIRQPSGLDLLHVFTSSTPLEQGRNYSRFGAYARLVHNGDYKAAARALSEQGYGERPTPRSKPQPPTNGVYRGITPDAPRRNLTDYGNCERIVDRHGNSIRFCHPWSKWLVWDGRRWRVDDTEEIERKAKESLRAIYAEASREDDPDRRKAVVSWARESEKAARIRAAMSLARSEAGIPILPPSMDRDPWGFNVLNGTIDLRTGNLRPHDRADLITKLAEVEFDPAAKCPLWDATLELVFRREDPDDTQDLIGYWRRVCGMAMAGVVRDHVLPIPYGTGSNGKTTVLGTIVDVFGSDYATKAAPDLLMAKRTEGHPTDRADLFGKRLVVAIETEAGGRFNEPLLKELTGGDRIRARRMREDFWEFAPTHTLIIATNHKPVVRGTDLGIWRRLKLIPFTTRIDPELADREMPEKLRNEAPGILAWCVRGCLDWQRVGLAEPPEVSTATAEYRADEDAIGGFLEEETVRGHGTLRVKSGVLHRAYVAWAEARNERAISARAFGTAIRERGLQTLRNNGIWYLGIGLRQQEHQTTFTEPAER